jgi:hypothetical protein
MIYIEPEHRLTITLTNTEGSNDISTFYTIVEKCHKESKKAGFKNMFTSAEKNVLLALAENLGLNKEQPAAKFTQIGPTTINIQE